MKIFQTKAGKIVAEVEVLKLGDIYEGQHYLYYDKGAWCVSTLDIECERPDIPIKMFMTAAKLPPCDLDGNGYKRETIVYILESLGYVPDDFFHWWCDCQGHDYSQRFLLEYLECKEFML